MYSCLYVIANHKSLVSYFFLVCISFAFPMLLLLVVAVYGYEALSRGIAGVSAASLSLARSCSRVAVAARLHDVSRSFFFFV
jgi:hypothetical protein